MKNPILLILFTLLTILSSCNSDEMITEPETGTLEFEISVPVSDYRARSGESRAFGDGGQLSLIKYYVYMQSAGLNAEPIESGQIPVETVNGKPGGKLHLLLPVVDKYDIVFIATSTTSLITYDTTNRRLSLNYSDGYVPNDDAPDCFYGVLKDIQTDKGYTHTITLKRPLAQLNIGTSDLTTYNGLSSSSFKTTTVTVKGIQQSLNVMDGSLYGGTVDFTFPAVGAISSRDFPVSGNLYLWMGYILAGDRKNTDVSLIFRSEDNSEFTTVVKDVPLERNHQTNLYGFLLTVTKDIKVEINPGFGGTSDNGLNTRPKEYDLILKVTDDCTRTTDPKFLSLVVEDEAGTTKTYDLTKYIDDEKMVKVCWTDLGIKSARAMRFNGNYYSNFYSNKNTQYVKCLQKCNISKFNLTSLRNFFNGCRFLEDISGIQEWDTSKIEDMSGMFQYCGLTELDLSNFDTSAVANMSEMFNHCERLETLNIERFITEKCSNMSWMFAYCESLKTLDVSKFNLSVCTDLSYTFISCKSLEVLDVSHFDTSKVTNMDRTFADCQKVRVLDVSNFNTGSCTNFNATFDDCYSITKLDVSHFDTSKATILANMFHCLTSPLEQGLPALDKIDVSGFDTANVADMSSMFDGRSELSSLDVSGFITNNVINFDYMFRRCSGLTVLDVSGFNTANCNSFIAMFENCSGLTVLDTSGFRSNNLRFTRSMFEGCTRVNELDISGFNDWRSIPSAGADRMFKDCTGLTTIYYSEWPTGNNILQNCPATRVKI